MYVYTYIHTLEGGGRKSSYDDTMSVGVDFLLIGSKQRKLS